MFGGDDDDDFMPVANSKLASLFSSKATAGGNTSLTYTAPKQPKRGGTVKNESRSTGSSANPQTGGGSSVPSSGGTHHSASNTLGIITVNAVNTYKLEDGSYNLQGKLGAAILGNSTVCVYQLLLYKGKQHHVTSSKITPSFQYTVQANNYGTFYDDNKQNWSIHFDQAEDAEEFAKEVGLARSCAQGNSREIQSLLYQEVVPGEGPEADVGDSMEIFYTVKLFSDGKRGQVIETNVNAEKPQRVKIRTNVWEEGLVGARKGSKRIILLPPSLAGPWKQESRPNASLVVEVEAFRLKSSRGSRESTPSQLPTMESAESAVESSADETSIKARGASISEALTASPKTHKANIISRMAKMGQATLPLKGAIVCNPSDTDSETEMDSSAKPTLIFKPTPKVRSPKTQSKGAKAPSPPDQPPGASVTPQHLAMYQPQPTWHHLPSQPYMMGQFPSGAMEGQLYSMVGSQTVSSHQLMPTTLATVGTPPGMSSSADGQLAVFLSENRTHNTEVRIGLAKVADKVDQVLAKLDSVQSTRPAVQSALLDSSTLLASIQKLVSENEQLKAELVDKGNKIEVQNDRIYQLLNTNHKYLEQSNASSSNEALIAGLQQEKIKLLEEATTSKEKVLTLQAQLDNCKREQTENSNNVTNQVTKHQEELAESKSIIDEQNEYIQSLTEKLKRSLEAQDCHEKTITALRSSIQEMQNLKDKLNTDLDEVTHQLNLQKRESNEQIKMLTAQYSSQIAALEMREATVEERKALPLENKSVIDEVKKIMNVVYKALQREFVAGETYLGRDIKETLGTIIRDITCQLIEQETFTTSADVKSQPKRVDSSSTLASTHSTHSIQEREIHSSVSSLSHQSGPEVGSDQYRHELRAEGSISSMVRPMEPPKQQGNVLDDSADGPRDESASSSSVVENCAAGNAGDVPTVPLAKLHGEIDLSLKLESANSESLEETPNHLRVTSDSCVLGAPVTRISEEGRKEAVSVAPQDSVVKPPTGSTNTVADGQQATEHKTNETLDKVPRDPSLERKPWRSEPPPAPLFDDDEDEDDWLS